MESLTVADAADVPEGGSVVVDVRGKAVAVFRSGGRLYALDDRCPHAGAPLSGGFVEDGAVTCPWHYWRFALTDGTWLDNPRVKTGCYAAREEAGKVVLEVPTIGERSA